MHDYGLFSFRSKDEVLAKSMEFWNPGKTQFWVDAGVPLVIDRRDGYFLFDMSGKRLIDVHLNGGTYNLGHRNPKVAAALTAAMDRFDIGNHHFAALTRTALAEALVRSAPPGLTKVIYGSGGGEAVDIALKTARHATRKRRIVSIIKAYHGHTGLAVGTGDDRFSTLFLADRPEEFYIADEVQTGLMRTGEMWGISKHGIEPDLMVIGKGISGGLYPISAVLVNERAGGWLSEDGFGHISTFGGAELGCVAAPKTLEVCGRPRTRSTVHYIADTIGAGLRRIQADYPDWLVGIRQNGVVIGLEFAHPEGAKLVMKQLYENGVWAIFSTLDPRVLQYKPGLLDRTEVAIGRAWREVAQPARRAS